MSTEDAEWIRIRGARTHNLRNIDVDLPVGKLVVVTGVSGSGKSSLAFDTLFAEGQRRYLESVSVQTRSLLRQLPRPDVDEITGLAPTVSVDQRVSSVPVRATLATTTEIHDFLRLLYSRAGMAHCTGCGREVQRQSIDQILRLALRLPERTRLMILSPMIRGRRGAHRETLERISRNGFVRARINGTIVDVADSIQLDPSKVHTIDAVVDRIVLKEGIETRLRESIELACRESDGTCIICHETDGQWAEKLYSTLFNCPDCDLSFPTPEPRLFSFGSPSGACSACSGLGIQGAVESETGLITFHQKLCPECQGSRLQPFPRSITFFGLTLGEFSRQSVTEARRCVQTWLSDITANPDSLRTQEIRLVAERTLPDILSRLKCLDDVGVGYLTLDRMTRTLSGGEFQRARLASSLSSQLFGAHFILDEPTSGLHPRDTQRLLRALSELRDAGGTVIVVEHDPDVMKSADWIVDLGPGAGTDGGQLLRSGTPEDVERNANSPTGDYLRSLTSRSQQQFFTRTPVNHTDTSAALTIRNARLHNLKQVTVRIPLNLMVCVSGVSGSGKSSLIMGTLLPVLSAALNQRHTTPMIAADVRCDGIDGMDQIRRLVALDQVPAGRSSRSCIATLCGIWNEIRRLYTKTREARVNGLRSEHFSFNSGEGRCPECRGTGIRNLRMNFLPDAITPCPVCHGRRFSEAICSVQFRDKSVADILEMRVDEAVEFFCEFQSLRATLQTFKDVGLGYLTLGQPASTFSVGELQRARLASELAEPSTDHTLYILDEPTRGLHPADVRRLIDHLQQLVNRGHSVIVIEHNMDVLMSCDWVIDVGPDSADSGGTVVHSGPPQELCNSSISETARILRVR
ncbi:MAG: excinuclease ABC subunit UvrA [Planctomycetota bacterium]